ncbi:MAG: hypothetical protein R3B09_28155 [Nannocystaceae bacterium]
MLAGLAHRPARGPSITWAALVALALLTLAPGCARRFKLTPKELEKVEAREGTSEGLRVFVHRKTILFYEEEVSQESFVVDRQIKERRVREPYILPITRGTPGKILGTTEMNGMPILWVTFDVRICDAVECGIGFVRTEDELYKLAVLPLREGYKAPVVYRRTEKKRNRMGLGKVKALAEANDVYVIARGKKRRRIKTVHLDIKKNIRETERRKVDRPTGVD